MAEGTKIPVDFGDKRHQADSPEPDPQPTDPASDASEAEAEQPAQEREPETTSPEAGLREELETTRERWLRAAADLENMRKRTASQVENERRRERNAILSAFLGPVDNLERALDAHKDDPRSESDVNPWAEGVRAIREQMLDALKQFGAVPLEALGQPFDPNRHEAVARIEDPDRPDGTVAEVIEAGYALRDGTVLRPAKVVVAYNAREGPEV